MDAPNTNGHRSGTSTVVVHTQPHYRNTLTRADTQINISRPAVQHNAGNTRVPCFSAFQRCYIVGGSFRHRGDHPTRHCAIVVSPLCIYIRICSGGRRSAIPILPCPKTRLRLVNVTHVRRCECMAMPTALWFGSRRARRLQFDPRTPNRIEANQTVSKVSAASIYRERTNMIPCLVKSMCACICVRNADRFSCVALCVCVRIPH